MYDKLRFFKGFDYDLNMVKNSDGIWEGNIYLDEVSTGLYETVNIFMLEEVGYYYPNQTTSATQPALVKPIQNSTGSTLVCRWIDDKSASKDIIIYAAEMKSGQPHVVQYDTIELNPELESTASYTTVDGVKYFAKQEFDKLSNTALQLNVALNSTTGGPHRRVLGIYDVSNGVETQIAQIAFYGEVVEEDERLRVLLQNFGATLDEGDFLLFKEHDISEQGVDHKLLNRKRKELLLELSNIKPFVGTYKALLNAIDFFGYNNITLKEYWMNIDKSKPSFGKLFAIPVPQSSKRGEALRKKLTVQIPSSTMKKTSRFSLVYRLNEPNGGFDEWDIPTVDEIFEFTPDEVIIKLYGLKQKLQREYLPLNAKIVDITAEGDFFTQKNLNIWNIQNGIGYFSEGHDIKFKILPEDRTLFIEDLGLVLETKFDNNDPDYINYLAKDPNAFQNLTGAEIEELVDLYTEFYDFYNDRDLRTFNTGIPVGCPIILDGRDSFEDTWNDANFVWNDAVDPNQSLLITWDNWWKTWVYEVEWLVNGPNGFTFETRGSIDTHLKMPMHVPYVGKYSVEMRTYDLFGHRSYYKEHDFFEVNLKEVDLYGVYRWLDNTRWNDKGLIWDKTGGYWSKPQDNDITVDEAIATLYLTLDRANYSHDDSQGIRFSTVRRFADPLSPSGFSETTGPYRWDESRFRWKDGEHNWWDATRIGSDLTASFKIYDIGNGDEIQITFKDPITGAITTGSHVITSPTPSSPVNTAQYEAEWKAIRDELNGSFVVATAATFATANISVNLNGEIEIAASNIGDPSNPNPWTPNALNNSAFLKSENSGEYVQISNISVTNDLITISPTGNIGFDASFYDTALGGHSQTTLTPYVRSTTDSIIQKFNWNAVFHDTNDDGYADTFLYMLAVGKEYSKNYDFEDVNVIPNGASTISYEPESATHVVHYNPGFDDTKIFRSYAEVERSTHLTISADITEMPGIDKPVWKIKNLSNPEINDIYYDSMWLTYIFQDPGTYEITLEVEDTNGNQNTVKRNMINVK